MTTSLFRGTTVLFFTSFFDAKGNLVTPAGASVHLTYIEAGQVANVSVEMTAPTGDEPQWTASWDSRNVSPGLVNWSIHTENSGLPYGVEDGNFILTANSANLPTF